MKKILLIGVTALASCSEQAGKEDMAVAISLNSRLDSLSYAIGVSVGASLLQQGMDTVSKDIFAEGFAAGMARNAEIMDAAMGQEVVQNHFGYLAKMKAEKGAAQSVAFMQQNKTQEGVIELPSGLQYKVITDGKGASPNVTDMVTTHYHGTLPNGEVFDSSKDRGEPATFAVNGVIKGWTEALQMMKVGSKWMLYVPPDLAYGGSGGGPGGGTEVLIFEVELLAINPK